MLRDAGGTDLPEKGAVAAEKLAISPSHHIVSFFSSLFVFYNAFASPWHCGTTSKHDR